MALYNKGLPGKAAPFIFIHIYRTGGTSVRSMLLSHHWARACAEIHGSHPLARDVRAHMLEEFDAAFKFTFVRNPFDWLVSIYTYIRQVPSHPDHSTVSPMPFSAFVEWWCYDMMQRDYIYGKNGCTTLTGFITDENGDLLVDYIGHMENFDKHISEVVELIGLGPGLQAQHLSQTQRILDYRPAYDDVTRAIVESVFAEDLERFSYSYW